MNSQEAATRKPFNLAEFLLRWEWMLVLLLVAVVILNASLSPYFLNVQNLLDMTFNFMERGIMTLPMTFIIITGNIDLSVASNMAMSSCVMGLLFGAGVNVWLAALGALVVGCLGGFINGLVITRLKIPALLTTLGTYALYRGIAWVLMENQAVTGFPERFTRLGQGDLSGTQVPIPLVIYLLLLVPFGLVLHRTAFGRFVYAIGGNKEVCRYSGVKIDRVLLVIFTLSGLLSALAGVIMVARFGSVRADVGQGAELDVITTVVLGGVDIFGGSGTMPGVFLALFLLGTVRYGMNLINIPPQVQIIITGLLLILAIFLPRVTRQLTARRLEPDEKPRERRATKRWLPLGLGLVVVVVAVAGLVFLKDGHQSGSVETTRNVGETTGETIALPTSTPLVLKPTETPVAAPPTPTPRPTNTLAPTTTASPAEESTTPADPEESTQVVDVTPTPTFTPEPTQVPRPEVEMVEVGGGSFTMGSDENEPNEAPSHLVDLPTFYVDRFEVTNADFKAFVEAMGYKTDAEKSGDASSWRTYAEGKDNHPVVKVSFNDAQAFCEWMGKRLPTEDEWEKAARGPDGYIFPWGNLWDANNTNVKDSGLRGTAAVGSFSAGASFFGVEDMAGNVWEWADSPYLAYPGSTYQDPYYNQDYRILRGGGWFDDQQQVRTSNRSAADVTTANDDIGFRCASDGG